MEVGVEGADDGANSRGCSLGDCCFLGVDAAAAAAPVAMTPAAAPAARGPGEEDGTVGAGLGALIGAGLRSTGVDGAPIGLGRWIGKK